MVDPVLTQETNAVHCMHGDVDHHWAWCTRRWPLDSQPRLASRLLMTVECVRMLVGSMVNASTHWLPLLSGATCIHTPSSAPQAPNQGTRGAARLRSWQRCVAAWSRCFFTRSRTMQRRADDQQVLPDSAFAAIWSMSSPSLSGHGRHAQGVEQPSPLSVLIPSSSRPTSST
jgi:hypothetical protein